MSEADVSVFLRHNLDEQGFVGLDDAAKSRVAWPLRFTPAVCVALIVVGLALQSPIVLGAVALAGLSGVLLPRAMVVDLVYNHGVRHLFGAPPLPPTPMPRRFSYGISTVLLGASALSFQFGIPWLGFLFGGAVCLAGTVLTTTLWCLGSWLFRRMFSGRSA